MSEIVHFSSAVRKLEQYCRIHQIEQTLQSFDARLRFLGDLGSFALWLTVKTFYRNGFQPALNPVE